MVLSQAVPKCNKIILDFVKYFKELRTMENETVNAIREFNRFYTIVLGIVNHHILESDYSLTEARIIYELARAGGLRATELKEKLHIDEGYMSRILGRFVKDGILEKKQSKEDKRNYLLRLTVKGRKIAELINKQSDRQIAQLIGHLGKEEQDKLVASITQVKELLTQK